jgi:divalent metal cation (Fe/Co/Zn/Cd) transporter
MSLKAFHIFFITLASLMSAGCAVWAFKEHASPESQPWQLWFGIGGVVIMMALLVYGYSFLKKTKNLSYL